MPVTPRGDSFQATVNFPTLPKGRIRKTFASRVEAQQWELKTASALHSGRSAASVMAAVSGLPSTLSELVGVVERDHWSSQRDGKKSARLARNCIEVIGDIAPGEVTAQVIDGLVSTLKARGVANSTINKQMATFSKCLSVYAKKSGGARLSVGRLRETLHRIRFISEAEELVMLQWCDHNGQIDLADLIKLGADTGLRDRSELLSLRPENVMLDRNKSITGLIVFADATKTATTRSVPLTARSREIVKRRSALGRPLFEGLSAKMMAARWNAMREAMGLSDDKRFIPYSLRHTFCSRLVQRGVHLVTVKDLAGHSDIKMTMRYASMAPQNYAAAISTLEPLPPHATIGGECV